MKNYSLLRERTQLAIQIVGKWAGKKWSGENIRRCRGEREKEDEFKIIKIFYLKNNLILTSAVRMVSVIYLLLAFYSSNAVHTATCVYW